MLNSIYISVGIGIILGVLSGLGTGGGSLLILWLTMVNSMDPQTARNINLLFYIPSALIAFLFRRKQSDFRAKQVLPAILAGCIAAGIFSFIGTKADTGLLKKLFSFLLLFIGARELLYRPRKAK